MFFNNDIGLTNVNYDIVTFFNDDINHINGDSDNVTFFGDDMGLVGVDLNNVNLDDVKFDMNDPDTTTFIRFIA